MMLNPPPWVPNYPPTNPPTAQWYEQKIDLLAHTLQTERTHSLRLDNELDDLEDKVERLSQIVHSYKNANERLRSFAEGVINELERVREERDMEITEERERERAMEENRKLMLKNLGLERRAKRLERENRMLRERNGQLEREKEGESDEVGVVEED